MANAKKSLSSSQASRDLNLRLATVWKMMHKIRKEWLMMRLNY
ncbi:hypothetical protein [Spiroplasma endosymbiont of Notiophilus biguttatus]